MLSEPLLEHRTAQPYVAIRHKDGHDWGSERGLKWDSWTGPHGDGFGARLEKQNV
jgi:hypothetical protein